MAAAYGARAMATAVVIGLHGLFGTRADLLGRREWIGVTWRVGGAGFVYLQTAVKYNWESGGRVGSWLENEEKE